MTEAPKGGGVVGAYLRLYELVGNAQNEIATRNLWLEAMHPTADSIQAACASIWIEANRRRAQQPHDAPSSVTRTVITPKPTNGAPQCPKCKGPMFDQKKGKYPWKPGTPIFKCRDKEHCDGVIWEPKVETPAPLAGNDDDIGF